MAFQPIYYITLACPTVEASIKKIEEYIAHGAMALQLDMPSREPIYETPLVKAGMGQALETNDGYAFFMNTIRDIYKRYPALDLHLVAYPDVVETIGRQRFIAFCKSAKIASFMPVSQDIQYKISFKKDGLTVVESIDNDLNDIAVLHAATLRENDVVTFRYKDHTKHSQLGIATLAQKVSYLRERGVKSKIYAVEGISSQEMMREVRDSGMDGAFVGNVLMELWDNEDKLWSLFDAFQSLVEK